MIKIIKSVKKHTCKKCGIITHTFDRKCKNCRKIEDFNRDLQEYELYEGKQNRSKYFSINIDRFWEKRPENETYYYVYLNNRMDRAKILLERLDIYGFKFHNIIDNHYYYNDEGDEESIEFNTKYFRMITKDISKIRELIKTLVKLGENLFLELIITLKTILYVENEQDPHNKGFNNWIDLNGFM